MFIILPNVSFIRKKMGQPRFLILKDFSGTVKILFKTLMPVGCIISIIFFFSAYRTALVGHLPTDLKDHYCLARKITGIFYEGEKWIEVFFAFG